MSEQELVEIIRDWDGNLAVTLAKKIIAAGYRKIDPSKLTVLSEPEQREIIRASSESGDYIYGGAFNKRIAKAQLEHTKKELEL